MWFFVYLQIFYYARKWIHHPFNDYISKSNFTPNYGTSGLSYHGILLFYDEILSSCGLGFLSWCNVIFFTVWCAIVNMCYAFVMLWSVFIFIIFFWYHYGMYATIYLKCFCHNAVWLVTSHNSKNIDMTLWQDIPVGVRL